MVESLLKEYPNILVLRVRMPIVSDLLYERNFITKIIRYEKVGLCSVCDQADVQKCGTHFAVLCRWSTSPTR